MATNTSTIGTAQTHATIAIWEAATDIDLVGAGNIEIGLISTNENFDEAALVMAGATTDIDNYRKLTVASANRHAGVAGAGHARIYRSGAGHTIEIDEDFFFLEYMDNELFVTCDVSDEGIRIQEDVIGTIVSKSIIHFAGNVASTDGIYLSPTTGGAVTNVIDNCIVYGFQRAGIIAQNFQNDGTINSHVDFCTVINNGGDDSSVQQGGVVNHAEGTGINNANIFNVAALNNTGTKKKDFGESLLASGAVNWAGTDNIASDTSAEGKFTDSFDSVNLVESAPGANENFWVNDVDTPFDYLLGGENAFTKSQEGTDSRIGNEPDPRQDFSTDIVGRIRAGEPLISIGAYQFSQAGVNHIAQKSDNYYRRRVDS